jgi:NADH:ubiquinone oxidoreductase subunit 3 (subunit A)
MSGMANAVGLLAVAAVLLLVGCATQQTPKAIDAASPRDYNRDLYECERQATFAGVGTKQQVFDNCMKARGYKEK